MLKSREEFIENLALEQREAWGWSNQPCPDLITAIFKLKDEGRIKDYLRVSDQEMPEDEAEYDPHTKLLKLRDSTFRAANDIFGSHNHAKPRANFTIAHELGHILLNHEGVRHRNVSDRKTERIIVQRRIDEAEADRFAGAFLVPRNLVTLSDRIAAIELSERFQVSEAMARVRVAELEKMYRLQNRIRRQTPDSVREFLLEAKRRGFMINSLDDE